ncbi:MULTISPECIES: hypothetical protein [Prauserella salsuginis group]|uniref:Uncharacterized protein n=1 Tax=Prauserella salsuginis TaxID=387889 RepID=A0ABW6G0Y6_9PSEU|nr:MULTISPECIES: hypothetical protein [Prauserella salsuginis group]
MDTERADTTHLDGVNLGIAAQTGRRLVVLAIKEAHRLSMRELYTTIRNHTHCRHPHPVPLPRPQLDQPHSPRKRPGPLPMRQGA